MKLDPDSDNLPKRSEITPGPGEPEGTAWVWGKDDELGRLNLLTPRRKLAAAKLIQHGESVNLDWSAFLPNPPAFGREPFEFKIKSLGPMGNDDLYNMNTQSGSQWDGFRHVAMPHGDKHVFYNNLYQEEILSGTRCGIHAWADHGIVGRGVLIDYWAYAKKHSKTYDPTTTHAIPLSELLACAAEQNTTFQYGDILIIRSGYIEYYNGLSQEARAAITGTGIYDFNFVGVKVDDDMLDFLHDNYFAAVAGDMPAFEAWPPKAPFVAHTFLLPCWGLPIGEMWDLERLAEVCRKRGKWEFFFSSKPANVPGGVGSHPNAMAIF
ncbi:hypothetical protein BDY17DRAFT_320632 [Neohortaea acidophila]|uniref:Cyclase-domain-containing protein n=1 Tax=Neohortaea acidophila TaxID=245834 RepID=A0A6A6Q761_9PEZI|nr:uncharacterized protein BDY17DRAFT_320632 [Neohortaea acidophila]KAF2488132.1 hypothetical protein BDY17DRAFT_320632 [Neohortaea acidophila]